MSAARNTRRATGMGSASTALGAPKDEMLLTRKHESWSRKRLAKKVHSDPGLGYFGNPASQCSTVCDSSTRLSE